MKNLIKYGLKNAKHPLLIISNHIELNSNPKVIYANQEFCKQNDIKLEDVIDKDFSKVMGLEKDEELFIDIIDSLKTNIKWSGPIITNKEKFQVEYFEINPILDNENNTLYYFVIGYDIGKVDKTNKKTASFNSLDSLVDTIFSKYDFLKDFSENLNTHLWKTDLVGNLTYLNKKIKEDYGFVLNKNITEYLTQTSITALNEKLKNTTPINKISKLKLKLKKGSRRFVCCEYWPVYRKGIIVGFGGTLKDVTHNEKILQNLLALETQ